MLFLTEYRTIERFTTGEFKDKGSLFSSFAIPISTESDFKRNIESIKMAHPKANHHCYAFALGPGHQAFRFSDDREPSGTAGRPIMSVIKSNDLTDIMIVVVRYFGGTLLGVPGLIQAYRKSSENVISNSTIITKRIMERFQLEFPYQRMGDMEQLFKRHEVRVINRMQSESCTFLVDIPKDQIPFLMDTLINGHPYSQTCKIKAV